MQRVYSLLSAFVLLAFLGLIAIQIDVRMVDQESVSVEELDLEDTQESEQEEVEFQLGDFLPPASENQSRQFETKTYTNYHFAIKPNFKEVHSPPPEA